MTAWWHTPPPLLNRKQSLTVSLGDEETTQNTGGERELTSMTTVTIQFCNISFNTIRTVRNTEFESSQSTGFVAIDESLMIFCDQVRRHPRLTTTIVPKCGVVRVSGSKHFKRIISNSSQLIHMRGQLEPCNTVHVPQSFTSWQSGAGNYTA